MIDRAVITSRRSDDTSARTLFPRAALAVVVPSHRCVFSVAPSRRVSCVTEDHPRCRRNTPSALRVGQPTIFLWVPDAIGYNTPRLIKTYYYEGRRTLRPVHSMESKRTGDSLSYSHSKTYSRRASNCLSATQEAYVPSVCRLIPGMRSAVAEQSVALPKPVEPKYNPHTRPAAVKPLYRPWFAARAAEARAQPTCRRRQRSPGGCHLVCHFKPMLSGAKRNETARNTTNEKRGDASAGRVFSRFSATERSRVLSPLRLPFRHSGRECR